MLNANNCATIYVSQTHGNDWFSGHLPYSDGYGAGPLKTIERACAMIYTMRAGNLNQPVTVKIMGDYHLSKTLGIGIVHAPRIYDLNQKMDNVTFESFSDDTYKTPARLIGGKKLTGFKKDVFNGVSCMSLFIPEVKEGKWRFTDLYVNGVAATRTRYPKNNTLTAITTEYPDPTQDFYTGSKWFVAHKEDLEGIDGIENSIVSFYHYWIDEHSPVESYDNKSGRLTMKYRSRFQITTDYEADRTSDLHYYLENVPQTFSEPGEWYLDINEGVLYYIPIEGFENFENLEIFAPVLDKIISIDGTPENRICGIRFKNLEILCSKGDYVSTSVYSRCAEVFPDEKEFASDIQSACGAYGAVSIEYSECCAIEGCKLSCLGVHAIEIKKGCSNIRVEKCEMTNLGGGGVKIFGALAHEDKSDFTSHCKISQNKISNCGKRLAASCGVLVCHSANNEISDNEICYLDYSGISCGWIWGYMPSSSYANLIRNNHIHHIGVGKLSDMGGIYLLGCQNGTIVEGNLVHDIKSNHYGGWGIYTDEGSSFITIENNTVYNCKSGCFHQHYGSYNTVKNNIMAFGGETIVRLSTREEHVGAIFEGNIFVTNDIPIYYFNDKSALPHPSVRANSNTVWDISKNEPIMCKFADWEISLETWQNIYNMDENTIIKNPEIFEKDSETGKYVIKA